MMQKEKGQRIADPFKELLCRRFFQSSFFHFLCELPTANNVTHYEQNKKANE